VEHRIRVAFFGISCIAAVSPSNMADRICTAVATMKIMYCASLTVSRGVADEEPPAAEKRSRVGAQMSKPVTG